MRRLAAMVCLAALAGMLLPLQVHAHRVNSFAWIDGDAIIVQGFFSKRRPAKNALVTVKAPGAAGILLEGATNATGEFRFPIPSRDLANGLEIILEAGDGHLATWTFSPEELLLFIAGNREPIRQPPDHEPPIPPGDPLHDPALQTLIQSAVRQELAPLQRELAHIKRQLEQPGPSMQDITAGLGFLIGLAGVAALVKRKS